MKTWILLPVIAVAASVLSVGNSQKVSSILYPSNQQIQKACSQSFKEGQAFNFEQDFFELINDEFGSDTVMFQTPLGSVKSACASDAQSLRVKPQVNSTTSLYALVVASGTVAELADAYRWNAVIIAKNAKGKELARVMPEVFSEKGQMENWDVSCNDGCSWTGSNYYFFRLTNKTFKQAVLGGASVFVLNQERGEITTYPVRLPTQVNVKTPVPVVQPIAKPIVQPTAKPIMEPAAKPKATSSGYVSDTVTYVSLAEFASKMPTAEFSDEVEGGTLFLNDNASVFYTGKLNFEGTNFGIRVLPGPPVVQNKIFLIPTRAFEAFGCTISLLDGNKKQVEVTCPYTDESDQIARATVQLIRF
jgi:hypothetical protein